MERAYYRETLAANLEAFGGKHSLKATDIARVFKIDPRTVKKRFPFDRSGYIEIEKLTSLMCLSKEEIRKAYYL